MKYATNKEGLHSMTATPYNQATQNHRQREEQDTKQNRIGQEAKQRLGDYFENT
jgi:hypothetical protein